MTQYMRKAFNLYTFAFNSPNNMVDFWLHRTTILGLKSNKIYWNKGAY